MCGLIHLSADERRHVEVVAVDAERTVVGDAAAAYREHLRVLQHLDHALPEGCVPVAVRRPPRHAHAEQRLDDPSLGQRHDARDADEDEEVINEGDVLEIEGVEGIDLGEDEEDIDEEFDLIQEGEDDDSYSVIDAPFDGE